jgi:hypothetical protein
VIETLILRIPSVATGQALETLNLTAVLAVTPTPLLNVRGAAVRTLFLIGACDFKRKVKVL